MKHILEKPFPQEKTCEKPAAPASPTTSTHTANAASQSASATPTPHVNSACSTPSTHTANAASRSASATPTPHVNSASPTASATPVTSSPQIPSRTAPAPTVTIIPASKPGTEGTSQLKDRRDIRVAAYCRVSTDDESQETSYEGQVTYYSTLIRQKPGWRFAGIYADKGISGTSDAHREEFKRMMEDTRAGKLDYILTKSISRFARNTVLTLESVRELKSLRPPVGIYFEKENIDSLDATGELLFTILSAMAQDESRSISDNIRWSIRKKFEAGIPQINFTNFLGYDKGKNGEWLINEAQADTVRLLYDTFLATGSVSGTVRFLNEQAVTTVTGRKWSFAGVRTVLRNEKYVGDLAMQKKVTEDYLNHRQAANTGQAPRYFIKNHHAPIIDRHTWNQVQEMLNENEGRRSHP